MLAAWTRRAADLTTRWWRSAMPLHGAFEKIEGGLSVPALGGKDVADPAVVIGGTPEFVTLPVDPDERLVQTPTPQGTGPVTSTPSLDLGGENRGRPVPPEPHRRVAGVDTALEEQSLDLLPWQCLSAP